MCSEHVKLSQAIDVNYYAFHCNFNYMPNKSIVNKMYCEQSKYCILVLIFGLFSDVIGMSDSMESKDGIVLIGKDVEGNGPRIIQVLSRIYLERLRKTEL
jgi:hypothetical protein